MNYEITMSAECFEVGIRTILWAVEATKRFGLDFSVESDQYQYLRNSVCWWSGVPAAADLVDRFVWDLDFGRGWVKSNSSVEMKLSTIEDLYLALLGTPVLI